MSEGKRAEQESKVSPAAGDQHDARPGETSAANPAGDAHSRPQCAGRAGRRILVVDDNYDARTSMQAILRVKGNEVRTARDGLEAVAVVAEFQPDLVLLDIGMPKLNGYDAARRIRDEHPGRKIMLVAITGWGEQQDFDRSRKAGFDDHLIKPIDPALLDELLARLG